MKSEKRVKFGKRKALLFVPLFAVLVFLSIGTASAATQHYVYPGESIQDAIDVANSSDSIEVHSGTYYETVNVTKQLVLRGVDTGEGKPIVDAGGDGSAIILCADEIVLEGFEVTNAGTGSRSSISQDGSSARVTLPDSAEAGIEVTSNGNIIKHNDVTNNNWYGIDLHVSCNNTIEDNNVSNNNWYGINLESSSNNTISNCTASNNEGGIVLNFDSNGNTITGNVESNNNGGIIITANSSDNIIVGNTVESNLWYGILLHESSGNVITGNDFISNTTNADSANSTNFWNSTEPLTYQYNNTTFTSYIGNFWSDYKGQDADGDGLGDTPYVIDSDKDKDKDHHPLMCRFENYSFI